MFIRKVLKLINNETFISLIILGQLVAEYINWVTFHFAVHCNFSLIPKMTDSKRVPYKIFKDKFWPWKREFHTNNLVDIMILYLKPSGCWPLDYGHYLPKSFSFLIKPLHWIFTFCSLFTAGHLAVLFFYRFLVKFMNSDYEALMELSDLLVGSIVYCFVVIVVTWCNAKFPLLLKIVNLIDEKFKMRSDIGI